MTSLTVVQDALAAFQRDDLQGVLDRCDPAIEWIYYGSGPWVGEFSGHDGVLRFFRLVADTLDFEAFEPREFVDGGDQVAVFGITAAKVKEVGGRFDNNWAQLYTIRGGKIVRYVGYDTTVVPR
jgi:ketosteroid isomerase-like protein